MDNVSLVSCSGCSACSLICPTLAISMEMNDKGFFACKVDSNKCIKCGKCLKVCPSIDRNMSEEFEDKEMYVVYAKDSHIFEKSSSGGLGYLLANYGLENKYNVCSVIYDESQQCAKHTFINKETLSKSQGSKYLQSLNDEAFKNLIQEKKKAIVFGTPCQITGLHKVLEMKKLRKDFILVDIFCHGVPSYLLWKNHLQSLKDKKKLKNIQQEASFRYKKNYRLKIGDYYEPYNGDAFMTFFLQNRLMNERCYKCTLRRKSDADIRIGDLMIDDYKKMNISPSVIIINTDKGKAVFEKIKEFLIIDNIPYKKVDAIQDKGIKQLPIDYEKDVKALQNAYAPSNMIKKILIRKKIKAVIRKSMYKTMERKNR